MPLYFIFILAIVRMLVKDTIYEPIPNPHDGAVLLTHNSSLLSGNIVVTPDEPMVHNIMEELSSFINVSPEDVIYVSSEEEIVDYYAAYQNTSVGLVFSEDPLTSTVYKIRINPKMFHLVPPQTLTTSETQCRSIVTYGLESGFSCPPNSYFDSGFLALQSAIDFTIIKLKTNQTVSELRLFLQSFPRNEFMSGGSTALRSVVPLYMVFAWSQFILYMMVLIVEEKEKRIKEGMKIMGLQGSVYWLSWVTIYSGYVLLLAIICVVVLPLAQVFQHANSVLLFILFMLYGMSSIFLALMLTPFFNKAKMAGIVGQLIQVAMSLLFYLQVFLSDKISSTAFWFMGLMSPCAFSFALDKVIFFDFAAGGLDWNNIWETEGGLPFAGSLIMITVDIFLYLGLGFYFDTVIPSEFGTKQKPWFIFQKSTWVKSERRVQSYRATTGLRSGIPNSTFDPDTHLEDDNPDLEPFPSEWKGREAVRIRDLRKVFRKGTKEEIEAVGGINMDIYEGQITAILGHNGAGKTTLFNMLTGMIAPSSGDATIFNLSISNPHDLLEIRRITGVCPQHDILFLNLTPREHLSFYAQIKGLPPSIIQDKVTEMLHETDLYSKANTKAEELSGGQKRKLSIGIALIGDPKLLFLDEPTAGVDAYSRRRLWTLLKKNKKGKVIMLTTHFMDEADILADRKAIVSQGRLRCYGTSMFLKNKFGLGYHLTMVISESCEGTKFIEQLVKSVISEAEFGRHYGRELSFLLPSSSTSKFTQLFKILDQNIEHTDGRPTNDIESYGVSMTTLEEVFLALHEEKTTSAVDSVENINRHLIHSRSQSLTSAQSVSGSPLHEVQQPMSEDGFKFEEVQVEKSSWRAFKALVKLRVTNLLREFRAVVFLTLMPLTFVIISIALASGSSIQFADDDPILLNADLYSSMENKVLIFNETGHNLFLFEDVLRDSNLVPSLYNGSYDYIYHNQSHFSSFDIYSSFQNSVNGSKVRFNSSFTHSLPILINIINNAIFDSFKDQTPSDVNENINTSRLTVYSQQLPLLENGQTEFEFGSYFSPFMIGFSFTMIPAALVIDVVWDREIGGQNVLRLNGVGFNMYFGSFLLVIGFLYLVSYVGLLVIIQAFQVESLVLPPAFATISVLYLLYMPGILLVSSCASYMFNKQETARQFYPSTCTTIGFVCYTVVMLLDLLKGSSTSRPLHYAFVVMVPYYIPFAALYYIGKVYIGCSIFKTCEELTFEDYMTPEIVAMFVMCAANVLIYYVLLKVCDVLKLGGNVMEVFGKKTKIQHIPQENADSDAPCLGDDDVREEKEKVASSFKNSVDAPALLHDVGKTYNVGKGKGKLCKKGKGSEFTAIKSVSFEVGAGEVFGLLGPNGAGKTSTLRIMTAEEAPTRGQVMVCGYNISSSLSSAYECVGYCPQHDCLWRNLTVSEHIECFAEIGGVKREHIKRMTDAYVKGLEIWEHRDKKSKDCSGGTKRKLSYILSMMGRPKVVLLDEPSTGMDPQSKRFLWNSIHASFKGDRSAILTTHSMEEADALCSRIGILVKGELRCIGSIQHLKNKYGSGYTLELKLRKKSEVLKCKESDESDSSANLIGGDELIPPDLTPEALNFWLKELVKRKFPNSFIDEEFDGRILFKIPQEDIGSLAQVFDILEELKKNNVVEEYVLSQTTLEQVFLRFARLQELEEEEEAKEKPGESSSLP